MKPMTRTWSTALAGTAALAAFAAMMTSVNALADTTATVATPDASNASVTKIETPTYKKILERTSVMFITQWYGSAVGKITDPVQPDEYGLTKANSGNSPQEFDNTLLATYKLDDKGLVAGFAVNEVFYMYGQGHTFVDPYLKIAKSNLIKNGGFTFGGDFRTYLPLSNLSHNAHRTTRFRSFSTANYDIPNTKFSLQSFNDINYYVYGDGASATARDFLVLVQPTINYQLMPQLGFYVGYEMDAQHNRNKPTLDLTAAGTWLYAGTSWDVTPKMNFSPYLALRPGGAVNADSTQIQAYFTYKLL